MRRSAIEAIAILLKHDFSAKDSVVESVTIVGAFTLQHNNEKIENRIPTPAARTPKPIFDPQIQSTQGFAGSQGQLALLNEYRGFEAEKTVASARVYPYLDINV